MYNKRKKEIKYKIENLLQGDYPEKKFIIDSIDDMEQEGLSYKEILEDILMFTASLVKQKQFMMNRNSGEIINKEVESLASDENWPFLSSIVKISISYRNKAFDSYCKNNKANLTDVEKLFEIQKEVVNSSVADLPEIFKSDYLKKKGFK